MLYDDLECFVLTYNRAELLRQQVESLCKQSAEGFVIRILDNASTDNTKEVVNEIKNKYPNREIELITHSENIGNPNNFKKTIELAKRKYCAVFHDDDIVHPDYIKGAMDNLRAHPNAVMASCRVEAMYNITDNNWNRYGLSYFKINPKDFTFMFMQGDRPSFAASIYKTDVYKTCQYHPELCGKIHDLPFMFEICSKGESIFFEGNFLRYRLSFHQDSANYKTGPFPDQIANALKIIINTIKKRKYFTKIRVYDFAIMLYYWEKLGNRGLSLEQFENILVDMDVFNKKELFYIKLGRKYLKKHIEKYVARKFNRSKNT